MARHVSFLEHPTSGTLIKALLGPTNTGKTHRAIQDLATMMTTHQGLVCVRVVGPSSELWVQGVGEFLVQGVM